MQGNFSYHNPTKLYFGDESLNYLKDELKNFGPVVLLNYGSGSVKRNGIYDQVSATPPAIWTLSPRTSRRYLRKVCDVIWVKRIIRKETSMSLLCGTDVF